MMKWLRVHTKQIMVVVVLLAMFSFVGGSALYNLLRTNPAKTTVMKVFDRKVTQGELGAAQSETDILESLLVPWKMDVSGKMNVQHWLMLVDEANQAGFVVPQQEIKSFITQRDEYRQKVGLGSLEDLRTRRKFTLPMIRRAVSHYLAVQKNLVRIIQASGPSEPQIRHFVRDTEEKIQVKFIALDANRFIDKKEILPEEALEKQFELYRSAKSGEGDMGFGYHYPDRVKVQYVIASKKKLEQQMDVSFEDVKSHWKANQSKYKKTIYVDPPPAATTQPTSQPAKKPEPIPEVRVKSFSEARSDVERELRKLKAGKIAQQCANKLAEELAKPWNTVPTEKSTGYKQSIPAEVKEAGYMKAVSDTVSRRYGIQLDYGETPFLSRQELDSNYVFGGAQTSGEGKDALSLPEYAFRVPAFYHQDGQGGLTDLKLQMYQTPLIPLTANGPGGFQVVDGRFVQQPGELDKYILFRIIAASSAHAPQSLSEVRQQVEQDVRIKRAFGRIEPVAQELYAVAARLGLEAALKKFDDAQTKWGVSRVSRPAAFARRTLLTKQALQAALESGKPVLVPSTVPGVGQSDEFIKAGFAMAAEDWSNPAVTPPQTDRIQSATTQPAAIPTPKTNLISIAKLRKWFIIEFVDHSPVNMTDYTSQYRQQAYYSLLGERSTVLRINWFDPDHIETRCAFVDVLRATPTDTSEGVKSPTPPEPIRF